ncbi:MAG: Asp-tRNA(Asn)/Glu-tRNA(Gln) amidotransferase subunit GatA [Ruminococcaceae bacterium]|nr:Asp-tRNA(Asn)/Glu-tRNA(Gln) amidotransferase subunit GatA [Oscillospiraceae bacterium]
MMHTLTAHEIRDQIKNKTLSSQEITKAFLDRIEKVEDKVESFVTVLPEEAMAAAAAVDKKIAAGEAVGALAGVPMALKDNLCTKDILTTCSSKMLYNFRPPYDSTVAKKLKDADTVLVGKVNMDEFAMGSSTENSYYKKTKNPYDITKVPGGSSGGSAACVSADEVAFSLGSDTGGSIRQPASLCGCVGMKPTYGTVSRFGLVAFASSLDQIGPLAKDVRDCAMVYDQIVGYDPMDSTSVKKEYESFEAALTGDVKGLKIGVPMEYMGEGISEPVQKAVLAALSSFKALGAEYEDMHLPLNEYALPAYYMISSAEASSNLARFDGVKYGFRAEKFDDLIDLYAQTRSEGFGAEVKRRIMIGTYALSSGYYDAYYKKAQQVRTLIMQDFDKAFEKYDVLVTPTTPTTAFGIGEKTSDPLQMYMADICTVSVNIGGLPAVVLPCGYDENGLPIGLQIIGKPFGEAAILNAAYALEKTISKVRPAL